MENIFVRIKYNVGDQFFFQIVVRHLRHYYPDAHITVESPRGTQAVYRGLADVCQVVSYPAKGKYIHLARCSQVYDAVPSTKATRCLIEEFDLEPIEDLYYYSLDISPAIQAKVDAWLQGLPSGLAILHNEAASSEAIKQLSADEFADLISQVQEAGYTPLIAHWRPCPLADGKTIYQPPNYFRQEVCPLLGDVDNDLETVAALIHRARLFIGIGAGPAVLAGALVTPALVLWRGFAAHHCYDLSDTWHAIPEGSPCSTYFLDRYRYVVGGISECVDEFLWLNKNA